MKSICNFIPAKRGADELKIVHFVYETEFEKMKQPFIYPIYYLHLVTRGEGALKLGGWEYKLGVGSLFFAFPGVPCEITGKDGFAYMYISFMGAKAAALLSDMKISPKSPVYNNISEELAPLWFRSIRRINQRNANVLCESVLLHTLSYIAEDGEEYSSKSFGVIDSIVGYVNNNYTDSTLSLKKVADIFAYNEKYLSHLFKENMKINFSQYLTRLRIRRAIEIIGNGERNIDAISLACGYKDSAYFAKVFKKLMQSTPHEYIKTANKTSPENEV